MSVQNDNPVKHACLLVSVFFQYDHSFIFAANNLYHRIAIFLYVPPRIHSPKLIHFVCIIWNNICTIAGLLRPLKSLITHVETNCFIISYYYLSAIVYTVEFTTPPLLLSGIVFVCIPCEPLVFEFFNFTQDGFLLIRIIEFPTIRRDKDWRVSNTKRGSHAYN